MSLPIYHRSRGSLLLTRSDRQAVEMADALATIGFDCVKEPMLIIRDVCFSREIATNAAALVFTSANGVDAFMNQGGRLGDRTLYAVGDQTAARLRDHGARSVLTGDGEGASLLRLIYSTWKPSSGRIVHVSGTHLSWDIASELEHGGYVTSRLVTYAAEPARSLSRTTVEALRNNEIVGVLLLSRRAAQTFCALPEIRQAGGLVHRVVAYCFSGKIAEVVPEGLFRAVRYASDPTREALLRLISAEADERGNS